MNLCGTGSVVAESVRILVLSCEAWLIGLNVGRSNGPVSDLTAGVLISLRGRGVGIGWCPHISGYWGHTDGV